MNLLTRNIAISDMHIKKITRDTINQCYEHFIKKFTLNMYVKTFHMWSIGFLDLKNIEIDTKIIVIGCHSADLLSKTCFGGGHL